MIEQRTKLTHHDTTKIAFITCLLVFAYLYVLVLKGFEVAARKQGKHKIKIWLKISNSGLKILDERTGVSSTAQIQQQHDIFDASASPLSLPIYRFLSVCLNI